MALNMFPPFRVRRVLPLETANTSLHNLAFTSTGNGSSAPDADERLHSFDEQYYTDAYVSIGKDEYADIVKSKPQAALRYHDDDDGETILVGSVFELEQRLQEPVPSISQVDKDGTGPQLGRSRELHAFDIERKQDVLNMWRGIHERSNLLGDKANQIDQEISFGQTSPLTRNALQTLRSQPDNDIHAQRWAAYSHLPASFSRNLAKQESLKVAQGSTFAQWPTPIDPRKESSPEEDRWATYNSQLQVSNDENIPPVFCSTIQVPSSQDQERNYKPLMELFEKQLADLASPTSSKSDVPTKSGIASGNTPGLPAVSHSISASCQDGVQYSQQHSMDSRVVSPGKEKKYFSRSSQSSSEVPTDTFRSIFANVEDLAASWQSSLAELHTRIIRAQQSASQGLGGPCTESMLPIQPQTVQNRSERSKLGSTLSRGIPISDTGAKAASSIGLPPPISARAIQEEAILECFAVQERNMTGHFQQQKKRLAEFLDREAETLSAHLAEQRSTLRYFLDTQRSSHKHTNGRDEKSAFIDGKLSLNQPPMSRPLPRADKSFKTSPKPSRFGSLSDSALNSFDVDKYLPNTFDFDSFLEKKSPTSSIPSNANLIDLSTHLSSLDPRSLTLEDRFRTNELMHHGQGRVQGEGVCLATSRADLLERQVEEIIARRVIHYDGTNALIASKVEQLLVRWLGFGPEFDTWCDRKSLLLDPKTVLEFEAKSSPLDSHSESEEKSGDLLLLSKLHNHPTAIVLNNHQALLSTTQQGSGQTYATGDNLPTYESETNQSAREISKPSIEGQQSSQAQSVVRPSSIDKVRSYPDPFVAPQVQTAAPSVSPFVLSPEMVADVPDSKFSAMSQEDSEEKEAWDMLAQHFNSSLRQVKRASPPPPQIVSRRKKDVQGSKSPLSEKPSFEFSPASIVQHMHPMSRVSKLNQSPMFSNDSEVASVSLSHSQNTDLSVLATEEENSLKSESEMEEVKRISSTLWQSSHLSKRSENTSDTRTASPPYRSSNLSLPPHNSKYFGDEQILDTSHKTSGILSDAPLHLSREISVPVVPPKPARLHTVSAHQAGVISPAQDSTPSDIRVAKPATLDYLSSNTAQMLAKIMDKEDFSMLGSSLLEGNDLDSTLDSLLFPKTVRDAQTPAKQTFCMPSNFEKFHGNSTKNSSVRSLKPTSKEFGFANSSSAIEAKNLNKVHTKKHVPSRPMPSLQEPLTQSKSGVTGADGRTPAPSANTLASPSSSSHNFDPNASPADKLCADQLIRMGFPPDKAELVSMSVGGNLEMALEAFDADQRIWHSKMKGKAKIDGRVSDEAMPGGWDAELYG